MAEVLRSEWLQPVYRPGLLATGTVTDAWEPVGRALRLNRGGALSRYIGGVASPS